MTTLKSLLVAAAFVLSHTASAGETRTATLHVEGMTCASCPLTVKQILKKQPGVSEASVDYKSQLAKVSFDPDKVQAEQLAKAVTDFGFPAKVRK
jgi:mercuric ion binding protein